jgi:hypothetical protein
MPGPFHLIIEEPIHSVAVVGHIQHPVVHAPFQDNVRETLKLHKAASRADGRKSKEVV